MGRSTRLAALRGVLHGVASSAPQIRQVTPRYGGIGGAVC